MLDGGLDAIRLAAWSLWRGLSAVLLTALQVVAALFVLFEEWGWRPLSNLLARLAQFRLWARLESAIAGLPPYAALVVIALPSTLLFPLKFVAVYLVANGHLVAATALFVAAKIVSTALIARLFLLVKPALMQIPWFVALHDRFVPWKDAVFARIRSSWVWRYGRMAKTAVRLEVKQAWQRWRPALHAGLARVRQQARAAWARLATRVSG